MATKIRLRRMGSRNKPFYRLVVADSRFAPTGRFLEIVGWYDPKKETDYFSVNLERVDYWIGTGAQLSATVKSLVKKTRASEKMAAVAAPILETPPIQDTTPDASIPIEETPVVKSEKVDKASVEDDAVLAEKTSEKQKA